MLLSHVKCQDVVSAIENRYSVKLPVSIVRHWLETQHGNRAVLERVAKQLANGKPVGQPIGWFTFDHAKVRQLIVTRLPRDKWDRRCQCIVSVRKDTDDILALAYLLWRTKGYYGNLLVRMAIGRYWREHYAACPPPVIGKRGAKARVRKIVNWSSVKSRSLTDVRLDLPDNLAPRFRLLLDCLNRGLSVEDTAKIMAVTPRHVRRVKLELTKILLDSLLE